MVSIPKTYLYYYKAYVTEVYDGDTITCDIDLGMHVFLKNQKVRLYGINTPEIRTKNPEEKKRGLAAREFLRSKVLHKEVVLRTMKDETGKFGRLLAIVMNSKDINQEMIKKGHAEVYLP